MQNLSKDNKYTLCNLKVNGEVKPLGVPLNKARVSWQIKSLAFGVKQTSYKVKLFLNGLQEWDSGEVISDDGFCVLPIKLKEQSDYTFTVEVVVNGLERLSLSSNFATCLGGKEKFFGAKWISSPKDENIGDVRYFYKGFNVGKQVKKAMLYVSALGVFEAYVNGKPVKKVDDGEEIYHVLKPGFTEASKRRFYFTYDVTEDICKGDNGLFATVTSGWWTGAVAGKYGKKVALWSKLVVVCDDDSVQEIVTDTTWLVSGYGAVRYADIFNGEIFDARLPVYRKLSEENSQTDFAVYNEEFDGELCPHPYPYITVRKDLELSPKKITVYDGIKDTVFDKDGKILQYGKISVVKEDLKFPFVLEKDQTCIIDFGQNFAGWEGFTVVGEEGTVLTITHGETVNDCNGRIDRGNDGPEGSVYNANYRSAKAETNYILKGNGEESFHPSYTFYGFRYLQIRTDYPVTILQVNGQVVTSVNKDTGFIRTSLDQINKLISNIRWGQYSNYLSVPTDCPQRDERQGWTADTQVFSETGCYLGDNEGFLRKFLQDMRDAQREDGATSGTAPTGEYHGAEWGGTGWADAIIIVTYNLYKAFGDVEVIRENFSAMEKYMDFLSTTDGFGPLPHWGDWLAYESNGKEVREVLGVAFYAWDALMMSEMANVLGYTQKAKHYQDLYLKEKEFFISKYVNDGKLIRDEQSLCLYALKLNLLPDKNSFDCVKKQLIDNLERNGKRLQTGFLGTAIIMDVLTELGKVDLAYDLLLQNKNPSWLYSVEQGATTMWERWNTYTKETGFGDVTMNSFNHYAYGSVFGWMFKTMLGINTVSGAEGFKKISFKPKYDERIAWVEGEYLSCVGDIKVKSSLMGDYWTYQVEVPANSSAEVCLPKTETFTANGVNAIKAEGVIGLEENSDGYLVKVLSGSYTFKVKIK